MKLENIKKIAVLGAGTMGPGIVQAYATGGYQVSMYTRRQETMDKAKVMMETNLTTFVEEGMIGEQEKADILSRISYTLDIAEAVKDAQYVQESVAEKPDIKTEIFKTLDELLDPDAIIVSNASSLNPFLFVPESRQKTFTTAHWFAPPHIIPLVEVAKGEQTSEETMSVVLAVLEKCGKMPVRLEKFVPGYIINRIQILLNTEVFYLLDNGYVTPEQLDIAVKSSLMPRGMVLGLVQRYDFTGLDISANNIKNATYVMPETSDHPKALFDHVDNGELGVKTGKGFFDYDGRSPAQLSKERDRKLIEVFRATGHMMKEKI